MYEHYEEAVTISLYDDHAASAAADDLEYVYLCAGCAEDRGADVTYLSTAAVGESLSCDECGSPNRDEDKKEEESY